MAEFGINRTEFCSSFWCILMDVCTTAVFMEHYRFLQTPQSCNSCTLIHSPNKHTEFMCLFIILRLQIHPNSTVKKLVFWTSGLLSHTMLHITETVYEASNVCITSLSFGENCMHVNITNFIYVNMYIAYSEWSEQEASSPLYFNISLKYAIRKVQGNQNILNGTCQILVHLSYNKTYTTCTRDILFVASKGVV